MDTGVPEIRWMKKISGPTLNKESLYNLEIAKKEGRLADVKRLQEELKPTIALLAQNFIHQLDQLLVHSDIHPGQFIDEDGTGDLNVLDTKNLLRLNKKDIEQGQLILKNLFKQRLEGKNAAEEGKEFVRKFLQEYDLTNAESRDKLLKDLLGDMEGKSPEEVLQEMLWRGQQEMDMPLKWTLILKDILNINRLCQDVGFVHIGEAIMYGTVQPEEEIDAGKVLALARRLMPNLTRDYILPEMIGGWRGKALSTFIKSDELAEKVGAKAKSWLSQLRSLKGEIDPQVRGQVNAWFNRLKDGEPFSLKEVSQKMGVPQSQIKEIISRGITHVIGKADAYIKNEAKINGSLTGFHLAQSTALKSAEGDEAMATRRGGIDLTPVNMNLETQNLGGAIRFHIDPVMLRQLQNAPGFVPVIINIQPMTNLRQFLGLNVQESVPATS